MVVLIYNSFKAFFFFVTVPPVSHAPLLLVHGCLFFSRLALNANTCLTFAGQRGFCVSVFFLHLYVTPIFRLRRRRHSSVCAFISSLVSPKFHLGTASLKRKFSLWSSSQRLILCHSWWRAPFRFLFWKSWMEVVVVAGEGTEGGGGRLGIRSKQFFTHCSFNFSCGLWSIYSRAPTHLTPGQLKIPPAPNSPLEKQEACRSQTQQRPCDCATARIHCRCFWPLLLRSVPSLCRPPIEQFCLIQRGSCFKLAVRPWSDALPARCTLTGNTVSTVGPRWAPAWRKTRRPLHMNGFSCGRPSHNKQILLQCFV